MASLQIADCLGDNSGDDDDSCIVDVEWSKLKVSHVKEGYRDGHSAGQEAALQPAFNRGFAQQVKVEARIAFYRGILTALKTLSDKSRQLTQQGIEINLSMDEVVEYERLLTELESTRRGTDSAGENAGGRGKSEKVPKRDSRTGVDSDTSEGETAGYLGGVAEMSGGRQSRGVVDGGSAGKGTGSEEGDLDRTKCCCGEGGQCCEGTSAPGKLSSPAASQGGCTNEGSALRTANQSRNKDEHTRVGCSAVTTESQPISEGGDSEGQMPHCMASVDPHRSKVSEGVAVDGGTACSVAEFAAPADEARHIAGHCEHLLRKLGIEDLLILDQFAKDN